MQMKTFSLQLINLLSPIGSLKLFFWMERGLWPVSLNSYWLGVLSYVVWPVLNIVYRKHQNSDLSHAEYTIQYSSFFTCKLGLKTLLKKPKSEIMHNYGVHLCVFNRGHNLAHPVRRILEVKEWSERQGDSKTIIMLKVSCQKVHYSNDVWR